MRSLSATLLSAALAVTATAAAASDLLDSCNVVWHSQSENAAGSMPAGGGDVGLNVWVEDDELLFYIGRSGTFDENNHMLKLGRMRIKLEPNPFISGGEFCQQLNLQEGCVKITASSDDHPGAEIKIWVEVFRPVVHVEIDCESETSVTASYENWRTEARQIPADDRRSRFPCMSLVGYPGKVTMYPDHVEFHDGGVLWYHRNRGGDLVFDKEIVQQGLESVKERIPNPLRNRTFGGIVRGDGFAPAGTSGGCYAETDYRAWRLKSDSPRKKHRLAVYLHTVQTETVEDWQCGLEDLVRQAAAEPRCAWQKNLAWWDGYWKRSHVYINSRNEDSNDLPGQAGRNFQLFRYLLACNAYGCWPTKFNGSFFTYDPAFVGNKRSVKTETPDYRTWGGGSFTAQNQRLVYWPFLKNGDFDMMGPQFRFYLRALPAAELRTNVYWGHEGASFTEQLENFGLPAGSIYGWLGAESKWGRREPGTPVGVQSLGCVYQFGHQLDFSFMMLEYYRFTGEDISRYLPFIESSVRFFDEHYQYRLKKKTGKPLDENGHLVIYPSRACETYVNARNPADVIAGLNAVLSRLLELPNSMVSCEKKEQYRDMLKRVPPLPVKEKDGKPYLAGADSWERFAVGEIPQLYAVFPYGLYGVGLPDLELALFTWNDTLNDKRQKKAKEPWYQGGIFAARMGLEEYAAEVALFKIVDSGLRFPAFRDTDDWCPDHNWMAVGMLGLQEMLMQTPGRKIYLFPAWPKDWNVDFKLHAPHQTTVECTYRDGRIERLEVTPKSRAADVVGESSEFRVQNGWRPDRGLQEKRYQVSFFHNPL